MNTLTREEMIRKVQYDIEYTERQLNEWKDGFTADPLYAFKWSETVIEKAALHSVLRITLKMLSDEERTIEKIVARLTGEVMRGARSVRSNGMHGKCDDYEIAAKVQVLEAVFGVEM